MSIPIYNSYLKKYAKEHRANSTLSEVILWNEGLKQYKLGYRFNRQKPIKSYIPDFYCRALNLLIELDGITHEDGVIKENKEEEDLKRQKELECEGFNILRFKDEEIIYNFEESLDRIKKWIREYENKCPNVLSYKKLPKSMF